MGRMNVGPEFKVQTVQALRGKKLTVTQLLKIMDADEPQMRYCLNTLRKMGVVQTEGAPKRGQRALWFLTGRPIPPEAVAGAKRHPVDEKYDSEPLEAAMKGMKPCKDSCNTPRHTDS